MPLLTWTVWSCPSSSSVELSQGEERPRGANGTVLEPDAVPLYRFEARSFNDACREFYRRQGWGDYVPMLRLDGTPYPEDEADWESDRQRQRPEWS